MQSRVGRLCARRCTAATAALICSYPVSSRAYSAPAYPVNATDLPDPRIARPNTSSAHAHYTTGNRESGGAADPLYHRKNKERHPPFTKLDLQNPPQLPSPTYYATYDEYLDAYDHYLKDTDRFTTSARIFMQKRFQKLRATQIDVADAVRREYLWTFVPLLFCLSVFMVDRSNHSAALLAHRVIKERMQQQVKHVKWEKV